MVHIDPLEPRQFFAAGALDATFGGDGSVDVRTNVRRWVATATDVAVDDAGRTAVAAFYRSHRQVSVTRLRADGSVDATFGKNGIAAIDSGFNARANGAFQVTVDRGGRILVLLKDRLTRLNASGGFDRTFGNRGIVAKMSGSFVQVVDLTADASGRPLILGTAAGRTGTRGAIVRLTAAGAADPTFGGPAGGGAYKTPVPTKGDASGVAFRVLDDGKIVGAVDAVGRDGEHENIVTFRLIADGSLDDGYAVPTFDAVVQTKVNEDYRSESFAGFYDDGASLIASTSREIDGDHGGRVWIYRDADGRGASDFVDLAPTPVRDKIDPSYVDVASVLDGGELLMRFAFSTVAYTIGTPASGFAFGGELATSLSDRVIPSGDRALSFDLFPRDADRQPLASTVRISAVTLG